MTGDLRATPLYDWHTAHGGRMVDFAGWSMPVQYVSIVEEHRATRSAAALFDVSHMGRLRLAGPAAGDLLERLLTRRVADMRAGQVRYSLVTNEQGGILDDVLVYRLEDRAGRPEYLVVVNASNREKIVAWFRHHLPSEGVDLHDTTLDTAMIAVQGPRAIELADGLTQIDVAAMKYYTAAPTRIVGRDALVSRTGYTGEDGCELIVPADVAGELWQTLLDAGRAAGAMAAGLGARDTLRLEAAMPLYGHELRESIDPIQAGLEFAVNLDGRRFPGRDALAARTSDAARPRRVGLELDGRRPAREGHPILAGREQVGEVTSGTFSPTLDKPIAMGYIRPQHAAPGTAVEIEVRGRAEPAHVVKLPFYRRQAER